MGAGINLFKQLFPLDYYSYQTATLISSKPVSKVVKDSNDATIATYPLGGDELRGLLKVENGQLVAYGDVKDSSGQIYRPFATADEDSFTSFDGQTSPGGLHWVQTTVSNKRNGYAITNLLEVKNTDDGWVSSTPCLTMENGRLVIYTSENSLADFKTKYANLEIVYELATPTTSSGTAFTNPMISGSTEEFTDSRSLKMFCGHQSQYYTETEGDKLSALPEVTGEQGDFIINNADGKMTLKKRNVYSETEKVVGTWIDRRPIYEITLDGTFRAEDTRIAIQPPAYTLAILSASGFLLNSNETNAITINGCFDVTSAYYVVFDGITKNNILVERGTTNIGGSTPTAYVTIQYVKTT